MSLIEEIKKLRKATESRFNSFESIDMNFVFDKIESLIEQHQPSAEKLEELYNKHQWKNGKAFFKAIASECN